MVKKLVFIECEHQGALDAYAKDVTASGARVLEGHADPDDEEGYLIVEVVDMAAWARFIMAFKESKSAGFCMGSHSEE